MSRRPVAYSFFILPFLFFAQVSFTPKKYTYHKKEYFIYPVRSSNLSAVPPTAFTLPDGDYIIFTDYDFRDRFLSSKQKLRDTTKVSAIATIKNNLPNGKAIFYGYDYRFLGNKEKKKPTYRTETNFVNGLQDGECREYIENKISSLRNYRQGLPDGVWITYDLNGKPERKEKFRNERQCDTVFFYYPGGNISMMYDVMDPRDTSRQPPENFNDFFLKTRENYNPIGRDNNIKSFYKTFSPNGKIENDVRFTNGKNPVFDTLRSYYNLVIKEFSKPGEETKHLVEIYTEFSWSEKKTKIKTTRIEYYDGFDCYKTKEINTNTKTGETDSTVLSFIDYKALDFNSWRDTVFITKKIIAEKEIKKIHFIPAIGYAWTEFMNKPPLFKPVQVDTAKKTITTRDTFFYSPSKISKAREIEFREFQKTGKIKKSTASFRKHAFLFYGFDIKPEDHFSEAVTYLRDYDIGSFCNTFSGREKSVTFFNDGNPLNGKIILTNVKKLEGKKGFEVAPVYTDKIYTTLQRSDFVNGKRNGTMELLVKKNSKRVLQDLQKSFWLRPENGESYIIAHYKNGELHGELQHYKSDAFSYQKKEGYTEKSSLKKISSYLFADVNYSEGLLNGPYKEFYFNGKPRLVAEMNMGRYNGPLQVFDANGKLQMTCGFKNDSLHGDFISYSSFSNKKEEAHFENNNLQGNYIVYGESDQVPMLKINADKNILLRKEVFSPDGKLLEEIKFAENSQMEFIAQIAGYENFLELRKRKASIEKEEKMFASYKAFYESGKILCEGDIVKGYPKGKWKFYNVQGVLVNEVIFADTSFLSPGDYEPKKYAGAITGYFNNGKMRCKGFVKEWESGYDCNTHADKTRFAVFYSDAWTYEGAEIIKNGSGEGIISDENGMKISLGKLVNYKEEGVWKYYDPNQKLNETGKYVSGNKDGLWFSGDLENLNFEDAACFDPNSKSSRQQLEYSKNIINLTTELYRNGALLDSQTFETNLNKEPGTVKPKF